jgi:uncharacterized damage-inducible protein DinB
MTSPNFLATLYANELRHEGQVTRTIIAAVPDSQLGFRPHEKSMTAGQLISHLVESVDWVQGTVNTSDMNLEGYQPLSHGSVAEALADYDKYMAEALDTLSTVSDTALQEPWSMFHGTQVVMTLPKAVVIRSFVLSHLIHHRAQLGLYLRIMGEKVPIMYGATADDPGAFA